MAADRGRWKLNGWQSLIGSILLAVAVFLGFMSIGAGDIRYALAAVLVAAVTVVAAVLLGLWHGGTAVILGTAHVISASRPPVGNIVGRCDMSLLVDLPGMDPITVNHRDPAAPVPRWPRVGMVLPIEAAARNPRNLRVRWNSVPVQAGSVRYDEDADVVGPFYEEYGDQPAAPPPATPSPARPGGGSPVGTAPIGAQATAVILDEPIPPDSGLGTDHEPDAAPGPPAGSANGAAGARPSGARPWDGPPPEHPTVGPPVIDAQLLDDQVLDAELIDGQAILDETFVDEAFLDEALAGEILVDESLGEIPPHDPVLDDPAMDDPILDARIQEAWVVDPEGADDSVIPPVIPHQREEALVGEVVIDTSRVGEAARGIGMMLIVSDLAISLHFYRDVLGLHAVDVTDRTAELTFGGSRLLLCLVADMSPVNRRVEHLHLDVPDVEAAYHELLARGVDFPHAPRVITTRADGSELLAATFRDPDGHAVALTQWRERGDEG
jgi:catechol 2,3-dioxygenase-like lactoylglutathione lyase family enzyme